MTFRVAGIHDPDMNQTTQRKMNIKVKHLQGLEMTKKLSFLLEVRGSNNIDTDPYMGVELEDASNLRNDKRISWYYCSPDAVCDYTTNSYMYYNLEKRLTSRKQAVGFKFTPDSTRNGIVPLKGWIFSESSLERFSSGVSNRSPLKRQLDKMEMQFSSIPPPPNYRNGAGLVLCFVYRDQRDVMALKNNLSGAGLERYYASLKSYGYPTLSSIAGLSGPIMMALFQRCGMSEEDMKEFSYYLFCKSDGIEYKSLLMALECNK